MNIKLLLRNSRLQVSMILLGVWVIRLFEDFQVEYVYAPLIILATGVVVDRLLRRVVPVRVTPYSYLVTGLLVALIVSPDVSVWVGMAAVTLGVLAKYLIRGRQQWFNPAAFGIFVTSLVFGLPVDWWVISGSQVGTVALLVSMIYVLYKLRRLWIPATFLLVYFGQFLFLPRGVDAVLLLDGTVLLFAMVMLPEPRTSPTLGVWRYVFGLLVAGLAIGFGYVSVGASFDRLLAALLLANVTAFFMQLILKRINKSA